MDVKRRAQSAAELIAFLNSDNVRLTGAQLGMFNRWVELCQWVVKQSEPTDGKEGEGETS